MADVVIDMIHIVVLYLKTEVNYYFRKTILSEVQCSIIIIYSDIL